MVRTESPLCDFDAPAVDFDLPGIDGRGWSLEQCRGQNGTLVMFICNHCPYVIAVIERIVADCNLLATEGIKAVAIMSNDSDQYPEDNFEKMIEFGDRHRLTFPYLLDVDQNIAKSYGAVCTPDFFGYNQNLKLQYRGRLDESSKAAVANARRDLLLAMSSIGKTGTGPVEQIASMGCSIKWRDQ
ncbi:MAG: thioredoxin family protein [Immundisolibacteraceae bacterium]|nr:thioredoxin family protein [Immundisolibacteraceae bacterium]